MTAHNSTAYSVVHQRRSGGHAVISWLAGHFDGCFGHSNSNTWGKPRYKISYWIDPTWKVPERDGSIRKSTKGLSIIYDVDALAPHIPKDLLVVSYEDADPMSWTPIIPENEFGRTRRHVRILILRSFYNVMASRLMYGIDKSRFHAPGYKPDRVEMWLRDARVVACSDIDRYVPILYDRWFAEPAYRRKVEGWLGLREDDSRLQVIPPEGGGSSFDKRKLRNSAQKMDVLERWRLIDDWPSEILENDEARELNMRFFGWALDRNGQRIEP